MSDSLYQCSQFLLFCFRCHFSASFGNVLIPYQYESWMYTQVFVKLSINIVKLCTDLRLIVRNYAVSSCWYVPIGRLIFDKLFHFIMPSFCCVFSFSALTLLVG